MRWALLFFVWRHRSLPLTNRHCTLGCRVPLGQLVSADGSWRGGLDEWMWAWMPMWRRVCSVNETEQFRFRQRVASCAAVTYLTAGRTLTTGLMQGRRMRGGTNRPLTPVSVLNRELDEHRARPAANSAGGGASAEGSYSRNQRSPADTVAACRHLPESVRGGWAANASSLSSFGLSADRQPVEVGVGSKGGRVKRGPGA